MCYLALLVIGVGSWLFHMTLRYDMQLMDEIPMVFGAAALTYSVYQVNRVIFSYSYFLSGLFLYILCTGEATRG